MSLTMLSSNDIYALINYASFVESSFIGLSIAGMLYLRYKQPERTRPIKVRFILVHLLVTLKELTNTGEFKRLTNTDWTEVNLNR